MRGRYRKTGADVEAIISRWVQGHEPSPDELEGFTKSQRAVIAVRVMDHNKQAQESKNAADRAHRKVVRRATPVADREPCQVCGGFRPIAQQHHVRPVASQTAGSPADTRTVWLCPNCHTILHAWVANPMAFVGDDANEMLTREQWRAMAELVLGSGCWKGWPQTGGTNAND
jgi:hypothetical protein